jgi:uncharacterized glyoxalase superfamily protein PhnB
LTAEQNRWYAEEIKIDPMSKIQLSPYVNLAGRAPGHGVQMFKALAEGGQLKGQLTRQPWGGEIGYLMDRFGINWVVTVDNA